MPKASLISIASYVPEKILTNFDFEKMVDTSDEWIVKRTGIEQRHIATTENKSIQSHKTISEPTKQETPSTDALTVIKHTHTPPPHQTYNLANHHHSHKYRAGDFTPHKKQG